MKNKIFVLACLSITSFVAVAGAQTEPVKMDAHKSQDDLGAVKTATVHFLEPQDGATVAKTFKVKFAVDGLKVMKAGEIVPGSGHFHVVVDGPAIVEGVVVPFDATHLHYGKAQTEAELTLAPGEHTLTLQFADGAHRAYHKFLTQSIRVIVK